MADLEGAIRVAREAIEATPAAHPDRARNLDSLGIVLYDRYGHTRVMEDLEESIVLGRQAIEAAPADHPDLGALLSSLGNRLGERYSRNGQTGTADLEEAIQAGQDAMRITAPGHPKRAARLSNLSFLLRFRHQQTKTTADVEEMIRMGREAILITPSKDPKHSAYLTNLSIWLGDRYKQTGATADLDEAVKTAREALKATPSDHPNRAGRLANLGTRLSDRYYLNGAMMDLEETILAAREAVEVIPLQHPERPRDLTNLGLRLGDRYERTGVVSDLEEAIQLAQEVIDATPLNDPARAGRLNNLGVRLVDRFHRTGDLDHMEDLEEAIKAGHEAVTLVVIESRNRALHLNSLGAWLHERYEKKGAEADLEEAIRVGEETVKATSLEHPERARRISNLGNRFITRHQRHKATKDLLSALQCYEGALDQANSPTLMRVTAGKLVMEHSASIGEWDRAHRAASKAIELVPRLTVHSLETMDKRHLLNQVVGLASDAAAIALNADHSAVEALALLEQGRGVLAASLEEIRVDITDLQARQPALAEHYVRLCGILDAPVMRADLKAMDGRQLPWNVPTVDRSQASGELDTVIADIRKQPGCSGFLLSPTAVQMSAAAECGPVVLINVSQYRCDAILIELGQITSLSLPELKLQDLEGKGQGDVLGSVKVLGWLWGVVARPVLDALGYTQPPSDDDWPSMWWIPTGPLSRFPLHAAGRYGDGSVNSVLDRTISSYSSSVKAIIHGRQRYNPPMAALPPTRALLVAMDDTPDRKALTFPSAEVASVSTLLKSMAFETVQPAKQKRDILFLLPRCRVFHFAGHGYTNRQDPSKSYLLLKDWKQSPFTVADLQEMNLRQHAPFLAYLSACGTGRIEDNRSLDESTHLVSAYQLAGFRHVIGTLWDVNDKLCVDMASFTYEIEDHRPGYPRFSALIAAYEPYFVCRRFLRLRARLLLLKQDQLTLLERDLDDIDSNESHLLFLGQSRSDGNTQRLELLKQIEGSLADYDIFLERTQRALNLNPAKSRHIHSLQNWIQGTASLSRAETAYLDESKDLAQLALSGDDAMVRLETSVEDLLIRFYRGIRKSQHYDVSTDSNVYIHSGMLIKRTARLLLLILVTLMLLMPAVVCTLVSAAATRTLVIASSTVLYLVILLELTNPRIVEVMVAGATYVLLSGTFGMHH
ncbi:hypothetical protein LTR97_010226 [Elasticomyces elasticus]|uniref:CHAT domain-containing protein n=1 Tax=Elasticomyces elasticus TaxID=574655 RepID=A0AAN7VNW8_9PEZI|nr:hypothetical protein LTR97_010226 [Elasticomyces elasticus]